MKKNKLDFGTLLDDKRFTMLLSLVLAFLVWFAVSTFIDSQITKSISTQVNFSYNATSYRSLGLDIIQVPTRTINVRVSGDNSVVGGLESGDIIVSPDYSLVTGPGEYVLPLQIRKANSLDKFDIIGPSNQTVTVMFDNVVTQKFAITPNAAGVTPADGYYMDTPVVTPGEVVVSGAEAEVLRIDRVVASVQLNEVRSESAIANATLAFLDKEGNAIPTSNLVIDVEQVEVSIPIYRIRELPLTVSYINVPSGYDVSQLNATLSQSTIRVAGSAEQLDRLESIEVGIVNLAMFRLGESLTMNISLPDGLRNIDSLQTVTVTFDTRGYTSKVVTVTNVNAINVPTGMTITFPTMRVNNVVLIGTEEELESITDEDVVARVDASSSDISFVTKGQQNLRVQIVVPSTRTIFATGSYTILSEITTEG